MKQIKMYFLTILFSFSSFAFAQEIPYRYLSKGNIEVEYKNVDEDERLQRTPAYVNFSYSEDKCAIVRVKNPEKVFDFMQKKVFQDFLIYHESAHCDLYFSGLFFKKNLVNEIILTESLVYQREVPYLYGLVHELYADAFAYVFMRKDGWTDEEFQAIVDWRSEGEMMGNHRTSEMLSMIKDLDFTKPTEELKVEIKEFIDGYVSKKWVSQRFHYQLQDEVEMKKTIDSYYKNVIAACDLLHEKKMIDKDETLFYTLLTKSFKSGVKNEERDSAFHFAAKNCKVITNSPNN